MARRGEARLGLAGMDDDSAAWAQHDNELRHELELSMELDNMTFDELVPTESKYLRKEDVGEDGVIATIKHFTRETLKGGDGDEEKTIMHFVEDLKPMVLNKTNAQLVAVITGARKAGEAKGKKVIIYNDPTIGYGGKITGGLRLRKPQGQPRVLNEAQGDDIPF